MTTTTDAPPVLRPASVTAERERERLQRVAGRSGVAALVAGVLPGLRRLGSDEAAANGLRYRPLAWTIIAVVALSFHLPGRAERTVAPQIAAAPSAVTPVEPSAPVAPPEAEPVDAVPVPPGPTFTPPSTAPFAPTGPSASSGTPGIAPSTPPSPAPSTTDTPLTVRGSGWASRLPVTPLPTDAVPDGTLPVANRLGAVDRVSFVRLAGDASTLELAVDEEASREALGPGAVAVCPVEEPGWAEEPEQSFDDAPTWDGDACVAGVGSDGSWTFDMSSFDDITGDAGFALVPTVDAPPDFQIGFTTG